MTIMQVLTMNKINEFSLLRFSEQPGLQQAGLGLGMAGQDLATLDMAMVSEDLALAMATDMDVPDLATGDLVSVMDALDLVTGDLVSATDALDLATATKTSHAVEGTAFGCSLFVHKSNFKFVRSVSTSHIFPNASTRFQARLWDLHFFKDLQCDCETFPLCIRITM